MIICFHTFGCKLNQVETEELEKEIENQGWQAVGSKAQANVHLINACVVTQKAEREVRQLIHQIRRQSSGCFLVVAGCFTPEMKIREEKNVDLWLDNQEKQRTGQILLKNIRNKPDQSISKLGVKKRTRSLIKIQSGCQHYCTYCLVPFLRGKISNQPAEQIIQRIKNKEEQGWQEVILVGTNIGLYTDQKRDIDLNGLLKQILKRTTIPRIRLSSIWPTNINPELIFLMKNNPRICPHFHLSIQSASDKILKSMNREYTRADLKRVVNEIYQIPNVNLTADIIVGFPGEKDSDFEQTIRFVQWAKFLKVHVFRFSSRPKTKATLLKGQILEKVKQVRSRELIKLSEKVSQERKKDFLKHQNLVLIEIKQGKYWQGLTSNYLKIFIQSKKNLENKIIQVKLVRLYKDGIIGVLN